MPEIRLFPEAGVGMPEHPASGMQGEISWSPLWCECIHSDFLNCHGGHSTCYQNEIRNCFLHFSKNQGGEFAGKWVNKCQIRNVAFHSSGGWGTVETWGHCCSLLLTPCQAGVLEARLRVARSCRSRNCNTAPSPAGWAFR